MLNSDLSSKLEFLHDKLSRYNGILVAFSGGVDSSLLLKVASTTKVNILAVTALSPTYPEEEKEAATKLANELGVNHLVIYTNEMDNIDFTSNPPERCYFCKKELYNNLKELAKKHNLEVIVDGTNADDKNDFRPGKRAARECGIKSPLQEVGLTKNEIRTLAKYLGLPNWDKPSMACLSSRIPYGESITPQKLQQIAHAESYLHKLGFKEVRVRHHGSIARLEVNPSAFSVVTDDSVRKELISYFRKLGFTYITLDLQGFRSGSMNEVLKK
ncbi:MAG: pyridinium-3,5-biscarboxylic acid mononucleotide sulfurtransferase [Clostridia bacterium]|nr:pyridinium-3,5-biscarboxylic acid mononucleotide sulfurtransferase [Clostridia bacterium]